MIIYPFNRQLSHIGKLSSHCAMANDSYLPVSCENVKHQSLHRPNDFEQLLRQRLLIAGSHNRNSTRPTGWARSGPHFWTTLNNMTCAVQEIDAIVAVNNYDFNSLLTYLPMYLQLS